MLTTLTADPGVSSYTLADGDVLNVNGNYDGNLNVVFNGDGRVNVRRGAELGQARFTAAAGNPGFTRVFFYGGSSAEVVDYVGNGGNDGVVANNGSVLGNVVFDASRGGAGANALIKLNNGTTTEDIAFFGTGGRDQLIVGGNVASGNIAANLGGGNDLVKFLNSATVQAPSAPATGQLPEGVIELVTGGGIDTVRFEGGRYDNLAAVTGDGNDRIQLVGNSPGQTFRGAVDIRTGNGTDRIIATGITTALMGYNFDAGAGDDLLRLRNLKGGGDPVTEDPLVINAGTDGPGRDTIEIGGLDYVGTVDISFGGDVFINERGFNNYRATLFGDTALRISGGRTGTTTTVRLRSGSASTGTTSISTNGRLDLETNGFTTRSLQVNSVGAGDRVVLRGGGAVLSTTLNTGGGDDRIFFFDSFGFGETGRINAGSGSDFVSVASAVTRGFVNADFDGELGGRSELRIGNLQANGVRVDFAGGLVVRETQAQTFNVGYTLTEDRSSALAGTGTLALLADDQTSVGDLVINTTNRTVVEYGGSVGGQVDIKTGRFADLFNLVGLDWANPFLRFSIVTGAGNDTVDLIDATIDATGSRYDINLGGGDDVFINDGTQFSGPGLVNGGNGNDLATDPGNGNLTNF